LQEEEMKSFRQELWFELPSRTGFMNITIQVAGCVKQSSISEGLCLVNSMHVTASVFIDADESGLRQDWEQWLEGLAPHEPLMLYMHNKTGDDNGDAHLKRHILGREVVVAVTNDQLDLGRWEQIFYGELDGGRKKGVLVKIIGE
jgi:secondary thiamine-phosphate synthase enzyme